MRTRELTAVLSACLTLAAPAAAQYKWVEPGGQVTYSDQPPPPGTSAVVIGTPTSSARRGDDGSVPAALRATVSKYPVVLYTSADCAPCQQARLHLTRRGVPFSERTIVSSDDADAYRRVGFSENTVPGLTVGRERTVGYETVGWDRLLDAAGYPRSSLLTSTYRPPPPTPLAATGAARDAQGPNDADGLSETAAPRQDAAQTGTASSRPPRAQASRADPAAARNPSTLRF